MTTVVVALKVYFILGELFMIWCLGRRGRVVQEFRQLKSFPLAVLITMISIATWPMAFWMGRVR